MKFVKFPFSVLMDSRLSANDMRVLAVLIYRSHLDDENKCWPSKKDLARQTGIPEKKISGYTKRLQNFGWIEKLRSKGGAKSPQIYHVLTSPDLGSNKLAPIRGKNQPQLGVITSPDSGSVTPINKREKEKENERGNKKNHFSHLNSRKLSPADIKNSQANRRHILKLEKQQENANV